MTSIAFSIGFLSTVRTIRITAIDGIINLSLPNISKQIRAAETPIIEDKCDFSLSQLSMKITNSKAVMTKSNPGSSICINHPASEPIAAPLTQ